MDRTHNIGRAQAEAEAAGVPQLDPDPPKPGLGGATKAGCRGFDPWYGGSGLGSLGCIYMTAHSRSNSVGTGMILVETPPSSSAEG